MSDNFVPYVASETEDSDVEELDRYHVARIVRRRFLYVQDQSPFFEIPHDWIIPFEYSFNLIASDGHIRNAPRGIVSPPPPRASPVYQSPERDTPSPFLPSLLPRDETEETDETESPQEEREDDIPHQQLIDEIFGASEDEEDEEDTVETVVPEENGLYCYVEREFHQVATMPICANPRCGKTQCSECLRRWHGMGHRTCMFCRLPVNFSEAINLDLQN